MRVQRQHEKVHGCECKAGAECWSGTWAYGAPVNTVSLLDATRHLHKFIHARMSTSGLTYHNQAVPLSYGHDPSPPLSRATCSISPLT